MVATVLKLRYRILGNTLARRPWQLVGFCVGVLGALWMLGLVVTGIVALAVFQGLDVARTVVVLAGKDKGKSGEVTAVMPKDSKVVVAGVNIAVRHRKASQANPQGGLDRFEAPLHISNVALADPKTGKATRVRVETKDGKKVRVAVKSGETISG